MGDGRTPGLGGLEVCADGSDGDKGLSGASASAGARDNAVLRLRNAIAVSLTAWSRIWRI
jgi:hypothetical protein